MQVYTQALWIRYRTGLQLLIHKTCAWLQATLSALTITAVRHVAIKVPVNTDTMLPQL